MGVTPILACKILKKQIKTCIHLLPEFRTAFANTALSLHFPENQSKPHAMRKLLSILAAACLFTPIFAQTEVPVDMYTGQPSINIPIWNVVSNDISEPVTLTYNINNAREGTYGAGWDISAGGSITREVRMYPDDIGYFITKKGWLYANGGGANPPSNASVIGSFVPSADTLANTYDEASDYATINGFAYSKDTEPDIFSFNFAGMSGSFVFDNSLNIRTVPYQDIKIIPTYTSSPNKSITSFTITTNTGYVYTFAAIVSLTRQVADGSFFAENFYFPTEYEMYSSPVTFTREWKLTQITSPEGATVTFTYSSNGTQSNNRECKIANYQYPDPFYADPVNISYYTLYKMQESESSIKLASITTSAGPKVEFGTNDIKISDTRRGTTTAERLIKTFSFSYKPVTYAYDQGAFNRGETINFLTSISEYSGCDRIAPYKFEYAGVFTLDPTASYPGNYVMAANGADLWGYPGHQSGEHEFPQIYVYPSEPAAHRYRTTALSTHSGNEYIIPGVNRSSSTAAQTTGVLKTITSPEGGVTTFEFESNDYYDLKSTVTLKAGGLRTKSITYFDGVNPIPVKKTFLYLDPATNQSSGRLFGTPQYAVPTFVLKSGAGAAYDKTYTSLTTEMERWQYLTVRRSDEQSNSERTRGNTVGYSIVTVKRPGAGSARYEYSVPGVYGSFVSGAWRATRNQFARPNSSTSMGIVSAGGPWSFPYAPNPNFDYERGLVTRKSEFNEAGTLVKKTDYTYQYLYASGSTPYKVYGLKYERFIGSDAANKTFFYGRYNLLTDVIKVPKKETVTTYDITDGSGATYITESTEYFYQGANHKLLTQVKRTTSDGNIYSTRYRYAKDYSLVTSGAADAIAIGTLQNSTTLRHATPIEIIQTLKKGTDSTRVVNGTVQKWDPMGMGRPMVRSSWQLKTNPTIRIDSFYTSNITGTAGTYKFKIDSRYERVDSVLSYTTLGDVKSRYNPISRVTSATAYGYSSTIPVAELVNTTESYAGFSDFETNSGLEFTMATPYYGTGRSGTKAYYPGPLLSRTITKPANVSNYILGVWAKCSSYLTLNITLKNTSGTVSYGTTTITSLPTGSEFKYFQRTIPISGVTVSTFKVEIQGAGLSTNPSGTNGVNTITPSLLPVIDDVFFYPENAQMFGTTYTIPFGPSVVSSGTGNTVYTEYDQLGRFKVAYDGNRDIVKRNIYQYVNADPHVADFTVTNFTGYMGAETIFTAQTNECVTDATYEWKWSASGSFTSGSAVQTHTFDSAKVYQVTLRSTSPIYGVRTVTKSISVINQPLELEICVTGPVIYTTGVPTSTYICDVYTDIAKPNETLFWARPINPVSGEVFNYQWKIRDINSTTWINVGANSNKYAIKVLTGTTSFEVKCQLTSNLGRIVYTPVQSITINP